MQEKTLLKIALITSIVGLVVIYVISGNIVIEEKTLEKITIGNKDEFVKVRGMVSRITDLEKVTIMEITQPTEITIIMFKNGNESTIFAEGNEVEIIGKIDEYEGEMEIIAERARIVR